METVAPRFSRERLRALRQGAGLTQADLARRAGVREQQIIRWEGGRNVPSADAVGLLAGALRCEIAELYDESAADEDDEESDLLEAAHRLDRAGEYAMADRLRRRARAAARSRSSV